MLFRQLNTLWRDSALPVSTFIDQAASPAAQHLSAAPLPHQRGAFSIAHWKKILDTKWHRQCPTLQRAPHFFGSRILMWRLNVGSKDTAKDILVTTKPPPRRDAAANTNTRGWAPPPRPLRRGWNNQRKCNYANLMYSSYMNASPTPAALPVCAK